MLKKITLLFFAYLQASIALSDAPLIWGPSGTARLLNSGDLLGRNGDFYLHSPVNLIFPAVNAKGPLLNNGSGTLSWLVGTNSSFAGFDSSGTMISIPGMTFTPAGNVGIGVAPLSKLDIMGGISAGAYAGINAAPTNGMIVSGNVGIGTSSPLADLHVFDNAALTAAHTGILHTCSTTSSTASIAKVGLNVQSTGTWNGASATNTGLIVNATGGTTNYAATFSGGNVGIGTTVPALPLEDKGTAGIPATSGINSTGIMRLSTGGGFNAVLDVGLDTTSPNAFWMQTGHVTNFATRFPLSLNPNGGNVGIGTFAPAAPLEVITTNTGAITAFRVLATSNTGGGNSTVSSFGVASTSKNAAEVAFTYAGSGSNNNNAILRVNGTTGVVVAGSGNVGIATTTPAAPLHIAGTSAILGTGEGGTPSTALFRGANGTGTDRVGGAMTIQASNGTGAGGSGSIIFQTAPVAASSSTANVLATAMTITPSARVGIGSTSPAQLLDVASKFQVDTNGNILKINNIATSFPGSQGAASSLLQNNGSGVLSWAAAPTPTLQTVYDNDVDGGDATITTNATDGSVAIAGTESLKVSATNGLSVLSGTDTLNSTISGGIAQIRSAALPLLIQTNNNGIAGVGSAALTLKSGTSTSNFQTTGIASFGSGTSTGAVATTGDTFLSSGNSLNGISGALSLTTGNGGDYSGTITIATGTGGGFASPSGNVNISTGNSTNQPGGDITVIPGTGTANGKFLIGSTGQLQIDRTGNILKINNVATSFPASQGAASTVLTNNGSGVLTWSNSGSTVNVTTTASATVGQKIMTDSSGGAFTITLPASATLGDQIEIFDATDSWTANNITLARNGLNINGVAANFTLNVSGNYVRLIYYTAGQGWRTYP